MRLNGTFPAKFQHLYTSLTWRFLGWSGARETLSVVSLPPSSFGLHPSLERQSRCAQGDGARGVRDVQVSLPIPERRARLTWTFC